MTTEFSIDGRHVGSNRAPYVIAEIGQAHDGSLGTAHAFIEIAADAGADAIKFQTHIASAESTRDEEFRVKFSYQDASRFEYWQRMSFAPEHWAGLFQHAKERGVTLLSSPFSMEAVDLLRNLGMPAWKIGSGETLSTDIFAAVKSTGAPLLVSTGMSTWSEIDAVHADLSASGNPFAIFQCTSEYPTPFEHVGLNVIDEMRAKYDCPIGLSDHSGHAVPSIAAMARGASLIEVHLTLHEKAFGPDVPASLTPAGLASLCEARDIVACMINNPVDKNIKAESLSTMRGLFSKSLAPRQDMKAGQVVRDEDVVLKKPASGISGNERDTVIGKTLCRDVSSERLFTMDDFEA